MYCKDDYRDSLSIQSTCSHFWPVEETKKMQFGDIEVDLNCKSKEIDFNMYKLTVTDYSNVSV